MKIRILTLALALLFVVQIASAATVPSRRTADLYIVKVTKLDGSAIPAGLVITLVPETETVRTILAKVTAAIAGNKSVVSSFFADQQEAIRKVLPAGTGLNALQLKELTSLLVSGYTEDLGALVFRLTFPAKFEVDKPLVVMVGLVEGDQITWLVFAGVADQDGNVIVTLPAELLLKIQAGNAVISIL